MRFRLPIRKPSSNNLSFQILPELVSRRIGDYPLMGTASLGSASVAVLHPLVMANHFIDDEAQKLLAELGIEIGLGGELPETRDLRILASGVGGRQPGL